MAGLAAGGIFGRRPVLGRATPTGPLDGVSRADISSRIATYIELVGRGDPGRMNYRIASNQVDPLDPLLRGREVALRALAVDEAAGLLGAELLMAPAGGRMAEAQIVFFELAGGRIVETFVAHEGAQYLPGAGIAPARAPAFDVEPLPESSRFHGMTYRRFRDYLDLFGRFDERFVEYYTPDVVFTAAPAPAPIRGRAAVLELYRPLRANLGESVTVHRLAIDNRSGLMLAALTNRLTAFAEVQLPSRRMRAGDQLILSGAIVYGLRKGRISLIRDVGG